VLESRKQHEVSAEAVLLRAIRLTSDQCAVFAASRRQYPTGSSDQYFVDYAVSSRSWVAGAIHAGTGLPKETVLGECVAIGVKAEGHEDWGSSVGRVRIECVGVPPYPNHMFPRVVGIAKPQKQATSNIASITYVPGDATQPRAGGLHFFHQIIPPVGIVFPVSFRHLLGFGHCCSPRIKSAGTPRLRSNEDDARFVDSGKIVSKNSAAPVRVSSLGMRAGADRSGPSASVFRQSIFL
jgi:hypothetical protein